MPDSSYYARNYAGKNAAPPPKNGFHTNTPKQTGRFRCKQKYNINVLE